MRTATRYLEKRMVVDVERITGGRYRRVRVDDQTLDIRVFSPEKRDWVDVTELSQGTVDQIYLAARVGLVRLVTGDRRPPLIFDDPFVTFDDERAVRALDLLHDLAHDFQVIYLTTSDRYDAVADAVVALARAESRGRGPVRSVRWRGRDRRTFGTPIGPPTSAVAGGGLADRRLIPPELAVAAFGLLSAASWGTADFSGGIASRRSPALTVVLWCQPIGGLMALAFALVRGETSLPPADLALAALAGLLRSDRPRLLLPRPRRRTDGRRRPDRGRPRCGDPGPRRRLVLVGLPTPLQFAGIALALVSVVLVTAATIRRSATRAGARLAIVAGLGFGAFFVVLGRISAATVFAPLVVMRIVATIAIAAVVVVTHGTWRVARPSWLLVAIAGVLDMGGNLLYLLAAQAGRLDIAAVLASLYPIVTILLAAAILRERILAVQAVGIGVALLAIVLVTAG